MAKKPPVHVVARVDGWAVVREGNDRATSVRQTQAEAAREGRDIARRHETGFLLHGKDGRIREHNDYGSGQHPQEGASTGQATEDFAPGTQALGEPATNEEGQTVQRTTDEHGGIVETAFDEEGDVVEENFVGSVADLPGAEGYEETTEEEGITKRVVKDDSGVLIEVRIGPDGSVLDLQIPPGTEKVEETAQQVGQAVQGAHDSAEQATDQAQATTGQAQQDDVGGATRQTRDTVGQATEQADQATQGGAGQQAQDAAGQVTDRDQGPAGQTAGQASPGGQDTSGQTARRGAGGQRRDEEQAEGQGPNATPVARRKAGEMGVDLSQTEGTGSDGRITAKDVTSMAGGAQERADGGTPKQDEERRAGEQDREAEGGAQDAVGQATGQAVRGVQDTMEHVTEQARGLVGGLAGRGQQDEEKGRGGSQDTAGQAAGQARDATGGAAQHARDTAGQATRRDDQAARQGGGQQQGGGGQDPDATDAARRKAQEVGVDLSQVEGSGARGRITVNDVKTPPGPAKGGTTGEQRASGRAEQAEQGAQGTARQTAEEAGTVIGAASRGADRSAGRSSEAATDGARGAGTLEGRTADAEEVRSVTDMERDDDPFELVREGYADYEVYDQDGERIGKVGHLFLDEDDRPEYVGVETDVPDGRAVLVPAEVIPAENERRMVVSRSKSVVERGPTFGDGEEVTPELEERVRKHYGLPRSPGTEDSSGPDALTAEGQTERERGVTGAAGSGIRVGDTESGEFREHDRNVEGVSQPGSDLEDEDELRVRRSEEELRVGTREREAGNVNVRKSVRTDRERIEVPTRREEVSVERLPVQGETTETQIGEDEVSVPVVEEEAVVEKRPVAKEEIRIRKDVVEDTETVEEDVRREEIEVDDRTERRAR